MNAKQQETAVNPEEELKKLREKTDKDELAELKHRLLGGYKKGDVDQFVSRLKDQLQTVEKTFKSHISELTLQKDQLRGERDALLMRLAAYESASNEGREWIPPDAAVTIAGDEALQSELLDAKRSAEGLLADRASLEEKLQQLSRLADGDIAELKSRIVELETSLKEARSQCEGLAADKNALQAQMESQAKDSEALCEALESEKTALQEKLSELTGEHEAAVANLGAQIKEMEGRMADEEYAAAESGKKLEDARKKLIKKDEDILQLKGQLADTRKENCKFAEHISGCEREIEGLASQVEVAKQNILRLLADKEVVETMNTRLRDSLNTLVVKADAVIKENGVIAAQLEEERDRAQQYQAMHEKLTDMLARVRMANKMLDERVLDMDKSLSWGSGQISKPVAGARRRGTKAELLDFTDGKSTALRDIICELNSIQNNLAQYQQPAQQRDEPEKKPNIRYSVEKLEVDCPADTADKASDGLEEFILPVNGEFIKGR